MDVKNIIITGQTGTGKTSLALNIAKKLNSVILSADSRQIYKEMDIGTGKIDNPDDIRFTDNNWNLKGTRIYGINLINPDQQFSSGDFSEYGIKIVNENPNTVTIGGTGFYIKSLFDPAETIDIPQNQELRLTYSQLEQKLASDEYVKSLQEDLKKLNSSKFQSLNNSDVNNPRRLVRAIEVEIYKNQNIRLDPQTEKIDNQIWVGLHAPREYLSNKIRERINKMFEIGLENEVQNLLKKYSWDSPGMQTIGYIEFKEYFENQISKDQLIENIITSHMQYARKQMIYLKKFDQIHWIDISVSTDPLELALQYCKID
jgi:tRNA dimethylallyltransferase